MKKNRWLNYGAQLLKAPIYFYRWFISPCLGPRCRFVPTCSEYALDALDQHGPLRGSSLILKRILRCHPWCEGGHDPVPATQPVSQPFNQSTP